MSKLLKLKKWFSLYEAANQIELTLKEAVGATDVLRLALDGHLKLSVHLVNGAHGRVCLPISIDDIEWNEVPSLDGQQTIKIPVGGRVWKHNETWYQVTKSVASLSDGIWDLPMFGGERIDVEFSHQKLSFRPTPTAVSLDGVFVQGLTGKLYELQSQHEKSLINKLQLVGDNKFHPAGALPEDIEFVVRPEALDVFLGLVKDEAVIIEKPLGNRERDSLLTIIAALCNEAKLDYTKHAKTAGMIQSTAAGMGLSIGESTIEGHLKKIPNALAGRMK